MFNTFQLQKLWKRSVAGGGWMAIETAEFSWTFRTNGWKVLAVRKVLLRNFSSSLTALWFVKIKIPIAFNSENISLIPSKSTRCLVGWEWAFKFLVRSGVWIIIVFSCDSSVNQSSILLRSIVRLSDEVYTSKYVELLMLWVDRLCFCFTTEQVRK